jgi:type IX secretion system PorP/SprF family membrane protein
MKSALRAGVQLGVANNQFNLTSLVLGDQLNNDGVQNPVSIESNSIMTNSKFYFDLGLGLLYYSEKYWLGAAAHHLTQPNIGFSAGKSTLPVAWSMHAGARFYVGREKGIQREVRKTFSPSFMLRNAANQFQFDFTGIYNLQPILVGFGYRGLPLMKYNRMQNDAFMLLAGYRTSSLLIAYSYDLTISNLGLSTLGAHELGLIIEFGERGATKRGARLINTPFPLLYSN